VHKILAQCSVVTRVLNLSDPQINGTG